MINLLDIIAFSFFLLVWSSYRLILKRFRPARPNISELINRQRLEWAKNMIVRDGRIVDSHLLSSLQQGNTFLASTAIIIAGAMTTILANSDSLAAYIAQAPFVHAFSLITFQIKVLMIAMTFVFAFYKFAWCSRLFNYTAIIIGAAPEPDHANQETIDRYIDTFAMINSFAGDHYNAGLRAYFFGLALAGWIIGPIALMLATIWTFAVIYRREYSSRSYRALETLADTSKE